MRDARAPICVIGAGILGMSAAYHLLESGAQDVAVLDAGEKGGAGTTPAGAGFVYRYAADVNRGHPTTSVEIEEFSIDFYRSLVEAGFDLEMKQNGNLVIRPDAEGLAAVAQGIFDHPLREDGTRALSAAEVEALTAGVIDAGGIAGGVYLPTGLQLTTARALEAIETLTVQGGAEVRYRTPVRRLLVENDRVVGVETPAGSVEASAVVVAAGAWSGELLAQIGFELPLVPVIATRFETATCGLPETLPTVQYHHGWLREYRGGFSWGDIDGYKVAAYSSRALLSGGRPVVRELIQSNRSVVGSVARIFPKLGAAETAKVWQGIPVYTPDRRFYAGAVEPIAGLFMLTGDNEAGVTHGPGLGRLVADLVRGLEPRFDPEPYRPSRHPKVSLAEATRLVTARFAGRIGR